PVAFSARLNSGRIIRTPQESKDTQQWYRCVQGTDRHRLFSNSCVCFYCSSAARIRRQSSFKSFHGPLQTVARARVRTMGGNTIIVVCKQLVVVAACSCLGIQNHVVLRGTSTERIGKR